MLSAAVLDSILIIAKARQPNKSAVEFSRSIGYDPDPWQAEFLMSQSPCIQVNCSRQSGKTTTTGTLVAHQTIKIAGYQTVILAPGIRQGSILMRKIHTAYMRAGRPVPAKSESAFELRLENESSVLVLPGNEATSRGPSGIDMLLVEEAARVPDELYYAVLPMLATKPYAREIQLSTPFGTRGFFFEQWKKIQNKSAGKKWEYHEVPAEQCPRISQEFLDEMKRRMGPWWFEQEFHCKFMDAIGSLFGMTALDSMINPDLTPWELVIKLQNESIV